MNDFFITTREWLAKADPKEIELLLIIVEDAKYFRSLGVEKQSGRPKGSRNRKSSATATAHSATSNAD